jgi:SNF2 family DNA or RNA helicase
MSVLRNDLPLKKEFVIKVPLTDLQRKAYCIYVKYMLSKVALTKDGGIPQTTLWSWLAVLSLLCNHPYPFMMKLVEREAEVKNGGSSNPASRDSTDLDDIGIDLNSLAWKLGDTESLVDQEKRLFTEESDMKSVSLSCKTQILCQILDASKATGDRVLVFSQSIPTLDFLEEICRNQCRKYARLDGKTAINKRQKQTKDFNTGSLELYLISTTAGGLGLNLYGANRVVIFDFKFNPILEEQAVGRAYRIGQQKEVFVYRFVAGGTFEDLIHNKAIFKKQLASRVVDKKNPIARATKKSKDFLFEPTDVPQEDLSKLQGEDPDVLDNILASQTHKYVLVSLPLKFPSLAASSSIIEYLLTSSQQHNL